MRERFPEVAARVVGLRRSLLIIDMCRVPFIDSTGAAFLISLADASVKRGAQTLLRGCSDRHLFVLEVCGALDLFRIDRDFVCPTVSVDAPLNVVPEAG
ncbi:hypothetical protein GCM10010401_13190 [Rarobacter faecitabidus]